MPVLDFDMGIAARIGDIFPSPGLTVEFMPEELFERKRIVDKLINKETFSFISFWRTGFVFDPSRWDPAMMFDATEGYYNDVDKTSATLFNLFPVTFNYSFVFWDTKRESLDFYETLLLKDLYKTGPITSIIASDASGLQMNCYMDFDYKLEVTDEYILEKEDKVPYFKGKFEFKLEGWLYDINTESSLVNDIHLFTYNLNHFYLEDEWIPDPSGPSGDPGLPSGQPDTDLELLDIIYVDI
jgi:hypothetical protein